jgi:5,10-methenyltetrahydrofolate synthetase
MRRRVCKNGLMSAETSKSSASDIPVPEPTQLPQLKEGLSKRELRAIMRKIRRDTGPALDGSKYAAEVWSLFSAVSRSVKGTETRSVEGAETEGVQADESVSDVTWQQSAAPSEIGKIPALIGYEALPGELSLREFLSAVDARVWLPVISAANGRPLTELPVGFVSEGGDETLAVEAAVVFAPALAVDEVGVRLGQGGGWYDRALREVRRHSPGVLVFACVPSNVYVRAGLLPEEEHDIRVDGVITETGWRLF